MKKLLVILASGVLGVSPLLISQEKERDAFSPYVTADGAIQRPSEYREKWTHLGTYMVLNESAAGHGLHEVYTERSNIQAFKATGEWPDGTTIVKEVRHTGTARMTTGDAHWGTDMDVWFVMVKDRKGRYPKNPIWGDGWGWALFKSTDPDKQIATNYKNDCLTCHIPAKKTDWVYVDGYSLLRDKPLTASSSAPPSATSSSPTAVEQVTGAGSAEKGAQLFASSCKFCHNTDPKTERLGRDLREWPQGSSRVARTLRRKTYRRRSPKAETACLHSETSLVARK